VVITIDVSHAALQIRQLRVEDSCINGHLVRPEFGGLFLADSERETKFGVTAAPAGYLIRT